MLTSKLSGRFIPSGMDEVIEKDYGIEVFFNRKSLSAIFYRGKSLRHFWYYRFKSVEQMFDSINKSVSDILHNEQEKAERMAVQKKLSKELVASDHFKVGDIIVNSWGYDQTNVEFYQVIEVINKKIRVREIRRSTVEGSEGFDCCHVMPVKDEFRGEPFLLLLKAYSANGTVTARICNPESYYYFHRWDGKAEYCSWYA